MICEFMKMWQLMGCLPNRPISQDRPFVVRAEFVLSTIQWQSIEFLSFRCLHCLSQCKCIHLNRCVLYRWWWVCHRRAQISVSIVQFCSDVVADGVWFGCHGYSWFHRLARPRYSFANTTCVRSSSIESCHRWQISIEQTYETRARKRNSTKRNTWNEYACKFICVSCGHVLNGHNDGSHVFYSFFFFSGWKYVKYVPISWTWICICHTWYYQRFAQFCCHLNQFLI